MDEGYGIRHWPKLRDAGVPALLRKAAHVWDDYGFCQYSNQDRSLMAVDVVGALHLAAGGKLADMYSVPPNTAGTLDAAVAYVDSALPDGLYGWTDEPGRTKEDAVRLLNKLADLLETTI